MFNYMISFFIILVKYLLFVTYSSTDFEVHRNWKAITNSLPVELWYYDETSEWTMDYPPLFSYMELFLGYISKFFDQGITDLTNLKYISRRCLFFQRSSVLLCDILMMIALSHLKTTLKLSSRKFIYLLCLIQGCVGLILLDNIHFQYNTILFSLFIISISFILRENYILGAVIYCILINMKHIFICCAPAYLAFYIKFYVFDNNSKIQFKKFFTLALSMITVFILTYLPFILISIRENSLDIFSQIMSRLFPFKRGLLHSYWAPNFWAIYSFLDKIIFRILRGSTGSINQSSLGLTQDVSFDILPDITPKTVMFILSMLSLLLIIRAIRTANNCKSDFLKYLNLSCFIFFNFGFQVHEKAVINNSIILTIQYFLYLGDKTTHKLNDFYIIEHNFLLLCSIANLAQFPLINGIKEYPIKVFLVISFLLIISFVVKSTSKRYLILISILACLIMSLDLIYLITSHMNIPSTIPLMGSISKYRFLPIMMISVKSL